MTVYNPVEVKIRMRKIENTDGSHYYIGNSDMDVSLLDTVLMLFPPKENDDRGMLVVKNHKEKEEKRSYNNEDSYENSD